MKQINYTGSSKLISRIVNLLNRKAPLPLDGNGDPDWGTNGQVLSTDGSGKTTWVNQSGGGSGGHTIEKADGTDMTARALLQFIGAYLQDDAGNDRTIANIVRTMTQAQFNNLSAAEKEGLIYISDAAGQLTASEVALAAIAGMSATTAQSGIAELKGITDTLKSGSAYYHRRDDFWANGVANDANNFLGATTFAYASHSNTYSTGTLISFSSRNLTAYPLQIQNSYQYNTLAMRSKNGSSWSAWIPIFAPTTFSSQAITISGTGYKTIFTNTGVARTVFVAIGITVNLSTTASTAAFYLLKNQSGSNTYGFRQASTDATTGAQLVNFQLSSFIPLAVGDTVDLWTMTLSGASVSQIDCRIMY